MITEIVNGEEHLILNPKTENCPLCDTPLKEVCWSWNMFHGEATSSCCQMVCQIKSYHVDEARVEERAFAESLDNPERIEFCIDKKWIEPIREGFSKTGVKNCKDKEVYEIAKEVLAKEIVG